MQQLDVALKLANLVQLAAERPVKKLLRNQPVLRSGFLDVPQKGVAMHVPQILKAHAQHTWKRLGKALGEGANPRLQHAAKSTAAAQVRKKAPALAVSASKPLGK